MGRAERRHKPKQQSDYIHQEKRWKANNRELVGKVNAGIALELFRNHGFTNKQIVSILKGGQDIWLADDNVVNTCLKEVGINIGSGR